MGLNSTIVITNDCLDLIQNDKDFGRKVHDAICHCGVDPVDIVTEGQTVARVVDVRHNDNHVLIGVGDNTGQAVGYPAKGKVKWKTRQGGIRYVD